MSVCPVRDAYTPPPLKAKGGGKTQHCSEEKQWGIHPGRRGVCENGKRRVVRVVVGGGGGQGARGKGI